MGRAPPAFKHPTVLIYRGSRGTVAQIELPFLEASEFFDALLDALQTVRVPAEHNHCICRVSHSLL